MKKVNLLLVSLVAIVTLSVGFSSCGGGGSKKITTKEEAYIYLKGKVFSGSNSQGYYHRVDFDTSNKTCQVLWSQPRPQTGWIRIGGTFTYTINDDLDVVMKDEDGSFTLELTTLTFITTRDGRYKMREGVSLPWE